MIHVMETQESADAWVEWARENDVHLTHPFMRPAFIAGYLKAKRKHQPLDPPHVQVLRDHREFKGGVGCGPHCGEDLPGVTLHCRKDCCHEKPGAYDKVAPPICICTVNIVTEEIVDREASCPVHGVS